VPGLNILGRRAIRTLGISIDAALDQAKKNQRIAEASVDNLGHSSTEPGVPGPQEHATRALQPSSTHVEQNQPREGAATYNAVTKEYHVGDAVRILCFGPHRNRGPRWIPATVVKRRGSCNYAVRIHPNGPIWRRHWKHLRPRLAVTEDLDPGDVPAKPCGPDSTSPVRNIASEPAELSRSTSTLEPLPPNQLLTPTVNVPNQVFTPTVNGPNPVTSLQENEPGTLQHIECQPEATPNGPCLRRPKTNPLAKRGGVADGPTFATAARAWRTLQRTYRRQRWTFWLSGEVLYTIT
jgi:hypothetical protein